MAKWVKENGGLEEFERRSKAKAGCLYELIDNSNGFYAWVSDAYAGVEQNLATTIGRARLDFISNLSCPKVPRGAALSLANQRRIPHWWACVGLTTTATARNRACHKTELPTRLFLYRFSGKDGAIDEALEARFIKEAAAKGMVQLKGHR